jgi:hypothetical protein
MAVDQPPGASNLSQSDVGEQPPTTSNDSSRRASRRPRGGHRVDQAASNSALTPLSEGDVRSVATGEVISPDGTTPVPPPVRIETITPSAVLNSLGHSAEVRVHEQAPPVTVQATDVLQTVGADAEFRLRSQPTYIEFAGTQLARYAGGTIAIITGLITLYWIFGFWMFSFQIPPPNLPSPLPSDPAVLSQLTTDYGRISTSHQAMWDAHQTRVKDFFDTVVARTLLPVLTGILGYIFGAHRPTIAMRESDTETTTTSTRQR